jgi:uncharacterized repeat protein (TIGR02543 family)
MNLYRGGSQRHNVVPIVLAIVALSLPLVFVTSGEASGSNSTATPATFASGVQNTAPNDSFNAVSCSGTTCVAAGQFKDAAGNNEAMTETSSNGGATWSNAQPATFATGVQNTAPNDFFSAVSCSGTTCVAAGGFYHGAGNEAMTATSSDGGATWSNAQPATFASGVLNTAPNTYFIAVSCSGTTCVAAGELKDAAGNYEAMTATSSDGGATWSNAQPATFASGVQNTAPFDYFYAVSCSGTTCVAAGQFKDAAGNYEAMTEMTSSTTPATPHPAPPTLVLTLNSEGGTPEAGLIGFAGAVIALPTPSYAGKTFNGWFNAASGGSLVTSPYTLSASVTLYAQWTSITTTTTTTTPPPAPRRVPSAPHLIKATSKNHEVTLFFRAPVSSGTSAISGYDYSVNGLWHTAIVSPGHRILVRGLAVGHTWYVRLRAVNAAGHGPASNLANITP